MNEGFMAVRSREDVSRILEDKEGVVMVEGFFPGSGTVIYYGFGINKSTPRHLFA